MKDKKISVPKRYDEMMQPMLAGDIEDVGFFVRTLQRTALECVSKGDMDGLGEIIKTYVFVGTNSEVTVSLRNRKNRFIALCALACEKVLVARLEEHAVNAVWEHYSKLCEECKNTENINALTIKLLLDLTGRVKKHSERTLCTSAEKVKAYVAHHLSERISVAEIARDLGMNAGYLNSSFKQQTGKCITDYIQTQKVEAAKALLTSGDDPLSDIWTGLGYYDQSHFGKMFKRHTGLTPKQYRVVHL